MRRLILATAVALLGTMVERAPGADPKPADAPESASEPDPRPRPKAADGDAPLAKGFPAATKPGTIEVKRYPAYRSALAKSDRATTSTGDLMFFPLFDHIQRNDIAMTAPVINTFLTPRMIETPGTRGEVTMEFVYSSPKEGKPGPDGEKVEVKDHPARDFICLGVQGGLGDAEMRDRVAELRAWLEDHATEWVADGPPRRIGYHGPMTPIARRLWEVQIPVKAAR